MALDDDDKIMIASLVQNAMQAADADAGKLLDGKLSAVTDALKTCSDAVGAIGKRLDMIENDGARKRVDSHRRKADDAPRPEEEPEELAADGENTERAQLANAQSRADDVAVLFGERAPAPMIGERPGDYRRRLCKLFKKHSPVWAKADSFPKDEKTFERVEETIYADAAERGRQPPEVAAGQLLRRSRRTEGNHTINEYFGDPHAWMDFFAGPVKLQANGMWKTPVR